jgi:uncharacterized membrane protein YtjA (UPF0391 family)
VEVRHRGGGIRVACIQKAFSQQETSLTRSNFHDLKEITMLYWAAVFFIIALIAAVLGFGGIAAGAAGIAKILFFVFLVAFVVSLLMGVFRRGV